MVSYLFLSSEPKVKSLNPNAFSRDLSNVSPIVLFTTLKHVKYRFIFNNIISRPCGHSHPILRVIYNITFRSLLSSLISLSLFFCYMSNNTRCSLDETVLYCLRCPTGVWWNNCRLYIWLSIVCRLYTWLNIVYRV